MTNISPEIEARRDRAKEWFESLQTRIFAELERLGIAAGRAIAFEDSANGLRAARAAGLRCVVTPAIYTRNETFDGADTVLDSLAAFRLPESP